MLATEGGIGVAIFNRSRFKYMKHDEKVLRGVG